MLLLAIEWTILGFAMKTCFLGFRTIMLARVGLQVVLFVVGLSMTETRGIWLEVWATVVKICLILLSEVIFLCRWVLLERYRFMIG